MKIYLLGNIANVQTGPFGSQLHKEDYVEFGTPMVTVEHLGNRAFTKQNLPMISDSDKKRLNKYVLNEGDIVFSRVGSVDRCSYVDNKHLGWMFSGRCLRIRPCNVVYPLYLYYYFCMENTKQFIRNIAVGATMPSINTKLMKDLEVPLPTKEIQQKIASILSALDDKIELNNKINENLEQQAQAIFKSWFVDFEPFGGVMPEDMREVPLNELCEIVTKGTTPTTIGKHFSDKGINFLKAESILQNHSFDRNKFAHIDNDTHKVLKRSIIKEGDIVFTIAGTLGRFALVDNTIIPANTNQAVAIIRANKNVISSEYLYSFFIGNWHNEYYAKRVQQAVQANLSLATIKSLPIFVLSNKDMMRYNDLVTPICKAMKANEYENLCLSALRDTLLPKLMNGEIDVSKVKI